MIAKIALPAALAFIMFAMGLTLTLGDFRLVGRHPRAVLVGLGAQMLLLPALAFAIAALWRPRPEFAVGLVILAACPGGITSNLLTHLAGGRTALAVTLTAVTSLAGVVTIPLVVNVALAVFAGYSHPVELAVAPMIGGIFAVATLPLALGMGLRAAAPSLALKVERVARRLAAGLFALIVIGAFVGEWATLIGHSGEIVPAALVLNLGAMGVAAAVARSFALERPDTIAVVLETGLQNGALGIFVAATLLASPAMMTPSIIYALVMNLSALAVIVAARCRPAGQPS